MVSQDYLCLSALLLQGAKGSMPNKSNNSFDALDVVEMLPLHLMLPNGNLTDVIQRTQTVSIGDRPKWPWIDPFIVQLVPTLTEKNNSLTISLDGVKTMARN